MTKLCISAIFISGLLPGFQMADKVNKTSAGLAIKGYDPVAYFEDGKPEKGNPAYQFQWKGATWRFSSTARRDAFAKEPDRYAPQYGGCLGYEVGGGDNTASGPVGGWSIVGQARSTFYNEDVGERGKNT